MTDLASRPVHLGDDRIDVIVTTGFACDADDVDTRLSMLERAEVAVEQARARRAAVAKFDRTAYGDPSTALSLMGSMLQGLSNNELFWLTNRSSICAREAFSRQRPCSAGAIRNAA